MASCPTPLTAALVITGALGLAGCGEPHGAVVRATVLDSAGSPLRTSVEVVPDGGDESVARGRTGPDGAITLAVPDPGPWSLRIPGRAPPLPVLLRSNDTVTVRVRVLPGRRVQATFEDTASRAARWMAALLPSAGGKATPRRPVDSLSAAARAELDPLIRDALWYRVLLAAGPGPRRADAFAAGTESGPDAAPRPALDEALSTLPPSSPVWSWAGLDTWRVVEAAARVVEGADVAGDPEATAGRRVLAGRRAEAYLRRGAEEHPDPRARAAMLYGSMRLAAESGRGGAAAAAYRRLLADYPATEAAGRARRAPPETTVTVGRPVPAFELAPLDGQAPPLTPERLRGRVFLLDFWATWCVPCVAEMPTLHAAHAAYGPAELEIVSVSFDAEREAVRRFRERWPMPWRHAFAGLDALGSNPLALRFGVTSLPRAVLVDREGVVRAIDQGLRGDALAETLQRVVGPRADSTSGGDP